MATAMFDDIDIFYLANTFSSKQLRHEIRQAKIKTSVSQAYRGTNYQTAEDLFPWADFADACHEAITWQRQKAPTQTAPNGYIDIEAIKAANDIITVIEGYTRLRKTGKNFTGRCPIHNDKHPSMTVYPDQQSFHCYSCGKGGDIFSFVMAAENVDFRQTSKRLGGT